MSPIARSPTGALCFGFFPDPGDSRALASCESVRETFWTGFGDGHGDGGRSFSSTFESWRLWCDVMRMVGAENLRSMSGSLGDGVAAGEGITPYIAMALGCERLPLEFVAVSVASTCSAMHCVLHCDSSARRKRQLNLTQPAASRISGIVGRAMARLLSLQFVAGC